MKQSLIVGAVVLSLVSSAIAGEPATSVYNDFGRWIGYGYSDGYHACDRGNCNLTNVRHPEWRPASHRNHKQMGYPAYGQAYAETYGPGPGLAPTRGMPQPQWKNIPQSETSPERLPKPAAAEEARRFNQRTREFQTSRNQTSQNSLDISIPEPSAVR